MTALPTFANLAFSPYLGGVLATLQFDNGYGVSVARHSISYGHDAGLYELAVLDALGRLTYDTPITSDVLGWQTPEQVTELMHRVAALPPASNCAPDGTNRRGEGGSDGST